MFGNIVAMADAETTVGYYQSRANEYDATSWEHPGMDPTVSDRVQCVLSSLSTVRTLDVGCGTGYVSRWLPGRLTLMDASPAMLSIAKRRLPGVDSVRASAPSLPFPDSSFGRAFTANLYGHLTVDERSELVHEALRVADELVVLEQLASSGEFVEGPEKRQLMDGSEFTIHKCYFTIERLLQELGGGEVLMEGPVFGIVRRRSAA